MISREMNAIEIEVLNLIVNKGSFEKPITANDLRGGIGTIQTANPNRAEELVYRYGRRFREVLEVRA